MDACNNLCLAMLLQKHSDVLMTNVNIGIIEIILVRFLYVRTYDAAVIYNMRDVAAYVSE